MKLQISVDKIKYNVFNLYFILTNKICSMTTRVILIIISFNKIMYFWKKNVKVFIERDFELIKKMLTS